eukprot:7650158-Pyramimonas_sp.AAC.1
MRARGPRAPVAARRAAARQLSRTPAAASARPRGGQAAEGRRLQQRGPWRGEPLLPRGARPVSLGTLALS